MIELFFAAGIPFAIYLIFANTASLTEYAYILFWIFIACLIIFAVTVLINAFFTIKNTVELNKGKSKNDVQRSTTKKNKSRK